MMHPPIATPAPRNPDMSPEAIDQRLRELAQIYKLGMSLRDAQWLGPVSEVPPEAPPSKGGADAAMSVCAAMRQED